MGNLTVSNHAEDILMYSFGSRIRFSEVDKNGILALESLINYFQDCSTFQTEDGPANMAYMKERHIAWVLNFWQIEVTRFPKLGEEVVIGTVPYKIKGMLGFRNFFMDTAEGERLAVANSIWTLYDFDKLVPAKVTPEMEETYPTEEQLPMNYADRKIAVPSEGETREFEEITVKTYHLDTNDHVNNGQYIRIAKECLPDKNVGIASMRAEYRMQAKLGDTIQPVAVVTGPKEAPVYTISLNNAEGKPYCIVELKTV